MIRKSVAALLAVLILLPACQTMQSLSAPAASTESKPAIDPSDQKQIDDAMQKAYTAPIGQKVTWNNPESGNSGTIIAIKDGYSKQGAYCRQFQKTITAGGQPTKTDSDVCQMPDGSWKAAP